MKKILILSITLILLVFAGFSARNLLRNDATISSQSPISTVTPTVRKQQKINNTFITYLSDQSSETEVTYETIGEYDDSLITHEQSPKQWKLHWESTQLEITMNSDESSPYGSDLQPESITLASQLSGETPLYRIKIDEDFYFYSDTYYNDSCGQKYCSNGIISREKNSDLSIYCRTKDTNSQGVEFCDQIVVNLREKID